jgi:Kelch motif
LPALLDGRFIAPLPVHFILLIMSSLFVFPLSSASSTPQQIGKEYAWNKGSGMPIPMFEISATILDGKIYVVGGENKDGELSDLVQVYDFFLI